MKQISLELLGSLKSPERSTCFIVKLVSRITGDAFAFTTLDGALRINDGYHDLWYRPTNVLKPMNIQSSADMDVDNTELHGWFDDIVAQAIASGLLGAAECTISRVDYNHTEYGIEDIAYGMVGKAEFSANRQGSRNIEFRGLGNFLKKKRNPVWSLTCRNAFGDERCGMPFIWESGVISVVSHEYRIFKLTGVSQADGYYDFGVAKFLGGLNTNVELEVERWNSDGTVKLSFITPYPISDSTTVALRRDCNKFDVTCIDYNNIVNMAAEHLTPVQDQSLMVPGAYIKSSQAK